MEILNISCEKVTITELETKIVNWVENELSEGRDLIFACDVEYYLSDVDNKQARGAISSLVKKKVLDVNRKEGGLISKFYTLIP